MFSFFKKKFKKSEPEQKQPELEQDLPLPEASDSNKEAVSQEAQAELVNIPEPSAAPIVAETAPSQTEPKQSPESLAALNFDDLDAEKAAEPAPVEAEVVVSTPAPTATPTEAPTPAPTQALTPEPTLAPTAMPTTAPTPAPTQAATVAPTPEPTPESTTTPVLEEMRPVNEATTATTIETAAETEEAAESAEAPQGWARGITPNKALSGQLETDAQATTETAGEETSFFTQNWTRNIVAEDKEIVVKPTAAPVATAAPVVQQDPNQNFEPGQASGWTARLKQGLSKSRDKLGKSLAGVFGGAEIDDDLYEELETVLLTSDMGVEATEHLLEDVRQRVSLKGLKNPEELREALKDALVDLIAPLQKPLEIPAETKPFVIMMAGVNGAGKTTSIGKLATHYQRQGKSVLLAAGDTFRAAAREQLIEWGARNNVTVISQATGDSAAVCFDAMHAAQARGTDIVLADTAGRLPTQLHLMEEIKKVKRVMQKSMDTAPHEVILVLDANIGQNAVNQVIAFDDALGLTGLILTKLDGTAKGGVIAALAKTRPIPIRFIGVGEGIEDLRPFNARDYAEALLGD